MGKWEEAAQAVYNETQAALQTVYNSLNNGQQKQLLKQPTVKELFDRYGVEYIDD